MPWIPPILAEDAGAVSKLFHALTARMRPGCLMPHVLRRERPDTVESGGRKMNPAARGG